jgi:hypothetical protein
LLNLVIESTMLSSFAFRSAARFTAKARFHASALQEAKLNVQGLADLVDLKGQNVLVRVDLNVPLDKKVRVVVLLLVCCCASCTN